ncbi:MAG: hypothetical protein IT581_04775 [Verrucomicrobiales bacterium]|nr:hypothetical protein [Verrucomicrobiales bacterium]
MPLGFAEGLDGAGPRLGLLRRNELEHAGLEADATSDAAHDLRGLRFGELEGGGEALGDGVLVLAAQEVGGDEAALGVLMAAIAELSLLSEDWDSASGWKIPQQLRNRTAPGLHGWRGSAPGALCGGDDRSPDVRRPKCADCCPFMSNSALQARKTINLFSYWRVGMRDIGSAHFEPIEAPGATRASQARPIVTHCVSR